MDKKKIIKQKIKRMMDGSGGNVTRRSPFAHQPISTAVKNSSFGNRKNSILSKSKTVSSNIANNRANFDYNNSNGVQYSQAAPSFNTQYQNSLDGYGNNY